MNDKKQGIVVDAEKLKDIFAKIRSFIEKGDYENAVKDCLKAEEDLTEPVCKVWIWHFYPEMMKNK
jgi:hypothetical protein